MRAGNLISCTPSLIAPLSSIWREFQNHFPTFVRIIRELKRKIVFRKKEGKKKRPSQNQLLHQNLIWTSKFPSNLLRYLKYQKNPDTSHRTGKCVKSSSLLQNPSVDGRAGSTLSYCSVKRFSVRTVRKSLGLHWVLLTCQQLWLGMT